MMTRWDGIETERAVRESMNTAARSLEAAGYHIEEIDPPSFEEAARFFFTLIRTEEKLSTTRSIDTLGDEPLRRARASTMAYADELDFEGYVRALSQRAAILREWLLFFEQYPVLLTPVSAERAFPTSISKAMLPCAECSWHITRCSRYPSSVCPPWPCQPDWSTAFRSVFNSLRRAIAKN
jgi:Asp-tRNA(Asn)/Glu-tRNA(Gln) amidotransferase A subunit family amidase